MTFPPAIVVVQNINGRLIPTAEVTSLIEQTTKARITEIYLFFKKQIFARYFGLQYKPSSGAERGDVCVILLLFIIQDNLLENRVSFALSP